MVHTHTHKRRWWNVFQAVQSIIAVLKRISSGIADLRVKGKTRKPLGGNTEHFCDPAITKMSSTEHKMH